MKRGSRSSTRPTALSAAMPSTIHMDAEFTEKASAPKAISADQKYMISTALLCE